MCLIAANVVCKLTLSVTTAYPAGKVQGTSHVTLVNDIIRWVLVNVSVPVVLEQTGLAREVRKMPDGMTLMPWKLGQPLVWDVTCVGILASSRRGDLFFAQKIGIIIQCSNAASFLDTLPIGSDLEQLYRSK